MGKLNSVCVLFLYWVASYGSLGCPVMEYLVGYEEEMVNLPFYITVNSDKIDVYQITFLEENYLNVVYVNGVLHLNTTSGSVETIGDLAAGNLSIRILSMNSTYVGLYKLSGTPAPILIKCIQLSMRARPDPPKISNTVTDGNGKITIPGIEEKYVTLVCTSTGGYPKPNMFWYKSSNQTTPLISNSILTERVDRKYTLTYILKAKRVDDGQLFICQTSFNPPDPLYMNDNAFLYLSLKPSIPRIYIKDPVTESKTKIEIANCTSDGFRPNAITVSWNLNGITTPASVNSVQNSETCSVSARYEKIVGRELNGKVLGCVVNHTTLDVPLETSTNLNVHFGALDAILIGYATNIEADKGRNIELRCTSDSSNPRSNITWYRNNQPIFIDSLVKDSDGQYGGTMVSQTFVLENVQRSIDGDEIRCEIYNTIIQQAPVKSITKKLDLKYHPTLKISYGQSVNEGDSTSFTCEANSKPVSNLTWYHNNAPFNFARVDSDNLSVLTIPRVNRTHSGTFRCKAENGFKPDGINDTELIVKFKPLTVELIGNATNIVANGENKIKLNCTSGSSNPKSTILWYMNNESTQNNANIQESTGEYNGMITSQVIDFVAERDMDGDLVSCTVHNNIAEQNPISSDVIKLDLMFHPIAKISADNKVVEGETIIFRCNVDSKPESIMSWTHNGTRLPLATIVSSNVVEYTIGAVNRSQAGTYRCMADNGHLPNGFNQTILTVHYAPDVTVISTNITVNDNNTKLTCIPSGIPDTYTFADWQHTWAGQDIVQHTYRLGTNPTLSLRNLTYEYSGVYTCTVSNGIQGSFNQNAGKGTAYLEVRTFPIIITPGQIKIHASLNNDAIISVELYSNVEVNNVECFRNNSNIDCSTSMTEKDIELPVFGTPITTKGIVADIELTIHNMEQFGLYNVQITNAIGSSKIVIVDVIPEGPPELPSHVTIDTVLFNYVTLSWMPGVHGGFNQTFIIEYSRDGQVWLPNDKVERQGGKIEQRINGTISNLQEQSQYFFRIRSLNERGFSKYTDILNVTTAANQDKTESTISNLPIIAGGASCVVVVFAVVVFVILFFVRKNRRKRNHDGQHSKIPKTRREATNTTENNAENSINNIQDYYNIDRNPYEDLRRGNEDVHEYGTLNIFEGTVHQSNEDKVYENLKMSPVKRFE